jgi:hypothetical protein
MSQLPSGLSEKVDDEEDLARFLTQRSHYNSSGVKPSAFMPSPKDCSTSVSRHGREPVDDLIELGKVAAGDRSLYGAVIIKTAEVRNAALDVVSSEPPNLHALIQGWVWNDKDPELQKAQQKERALLLASVAHTPLIFDKH